MRRDTRGIPTARDIDHVGFTVPDLGEAIDFFTRVIGCDLLFRTGPSFDSTGGDWMTRHYGVHPRASLRTAMMRFGQITNIELLAWTYGGAARHSNEWSGAGAAHLAFYVHDLQAAAAYLGAERGVQVLGSPTVMTGEPNDGTEFVYVRTPWGMLLELVRWPPLMPYCAAPTARLVDNALGAIRTRLDKG